MLGMVGRHQPLLTRDCDRFGDELKAGVSNHRFLVIGAGGSIGQAVTKEIFKRNPRVLHAVDISENGLVELVRDLRSSLGYIDGDFKTFALDCGSDIFRSFTNANGPYDYVLNLSALKHVRAERDPYTLMRLIEVNILNTLHTIDIAKRTHAKKYFCVSTDKAANPVNMMGASKRIMELFLSQRSTDISISTARFANVAFSNGSLLDGFRYRIMKRQPISAPCDVRRYFVTSEEAGLLCLFSALLADNQEILFPKQGDNIHLEHFHVIAERYLHSLGFAALHCTSEDEARGRMAEASSNGQWPVYFFKSDTSGEKMFEEFYTDTEQVEWDRFHDLGVVRLPHTQDEKNLSEFLHRVDDIRKSGKWRKTDLLDAFTAIIPDFAHAETNKNLDGKM